MRKKSIWIRIESSKEKEKLQREVQELIDQDKRIMGDIETCIFAIKEETVSRMFCCLSDYAVKVLKDRYGDNNVRITERRLSFKECDSREYIADTLDRIADALESIDKTLSDCIDVNVSQSPY